MQIVYSGRSVEDARNARDVLAGCGIAAHIADPPPEGTQGANPATDLVRVLVDNRLLDRARRALQPWIAAKTRDEVDSEA